MKAVREKRSPLLDLTEDQVKDVFKQRANGVMLKKIAAKFPTLKPWHISMLLHRQYRAEVTIPHDILVKVNDTLQHRRPYKKGPAAQANGASAPEVSPDAKRDQLSHFTHACYEMVRMRRLCIDLGYPRDTLDLLYESVRDQSSS